MPAAEDADEEVADVLLRMRVIICVNSLLRSSAPRPSNCCDALGALEKWNKSERRVSSCLDHIAYSSYWKHGIPFNTADDLSFIGSITGL